MLKDREPITVLSPQSMSEDIIDVDSAFLGTTQQVRIYTYGEKHARPHVYIQAGLHAGEHPGILTAFELRKRLSNLALENRILGRIDVVPTANPVGLAQFVNGEVNGRYDFVGRQNFNRFFPDIARETIDRLDAVSAGSPDRQVLHTATEAVLDAVTPADHVEKLKRDLFRRALAADLVLDLHCDGESMLHVFAGSHKMAPARIIARELGAFVVAVGHSDSNFAFDDSLNRFWSAIAERYNEHLAPADIGSALTIELRGRADVSASFAAQDAGAILASLSELGAIAGGTQNDGVPVSSNIIEVESTNLETIHAPKPGIVSYRLERGQICAPGDVVADLIDPCGDTDNGLALKSQNGGLLFSRHISKLAYPGMELCKIAPQS